MDYNKIGNFIMTERKSKKLTQAKLAEKIFVSEKTISKWENGKGIPDTNVLPKLCEVLQVSVNELLNGERIPSQNYTSKAEQTLLELQKAKEEKDRILLSMETIVIVLSLITLLSAVLVANFLISELWLQITIISIGTLIVLISAVICLRIEQIAGYYVCAKCNHKYIPTYTQVFFAMHAGRTRYFKCPHCKKRSWNKKVIN